MKSLGGLALIAFTATAIAAWPAGAQEQFTIASAGGAWQQAQRNAWYTPFAQKMALKFKEEETSAGMARVQAMVQAHNVTERRGHRRHRAGAVRLRLRDPGAAGLEQDRAARRLPAGCRARLRHGPRRLRRRPRLQHRRDQERPADLGARAVRHQAMARQARHAEDRGQQSGMGAGSRRRAGRSDLQGAGNAARRRRAPSPSSTRSSRTSSGGRPARSRRSCSRRTKW